PHFYVQGLPVVGGRTKMFLEFSFRVFLRYERTRIHVAGSVSSIERYVPNPSRAQSGRGRVWVNTVAGNVPWYLYRYGAVAKQRLAEWNERLVERLVYQQTAKARAVDKQISPDIAGLFAADVRDIAVLGELHIDHVVQYLPDTSRHRVILHEVGKQARVEVISVGILYLEIIEHVLVEGALRRKLILHLVVKDLSIYEARRFLLIAHVGNGKTAIVERLFISFQLQPPLGYVETVHDFLSLKGMIEMAPLGVPVHEFDRELVCRIALRHPFGFIQAKKIEEEFDGAEGGFSDSDCRNV